MDEGIWQKDYSTRRWKITLAPIQMDKIIPIKETIDQINDNNENHKTGFCLSPRHQQIESVNELQLLMLFLSPQRGIFEEQPEYTL